MLGNYLLESTSAHLLPRDEGKPGSLGQITVTGRQSSILRLLDIESLQITLYIIKFITYNSQSDYILLCIEPTAPQ